MASPEIDYPRLSSGSESFGGCFNIRIEGEDSRHTLDFHEDRKSPVYNERNIPEPPPPPGKICSKSITHERGHGKSDSVPNETRDTWDKLFKDGYGADVHISTDNGSFIPAHYTLLRIASPILGNLLQQSKVKNGIRCIKILGVPHDAVFIFIRFLYSACYEERGMKTFVLHLLVLSHSYSVPSLKRVCIHLLEQGWLSPENVIDVLQLGRNCDVPRLIVVCIRMIVRNFITIASSEGWEVMRRANPTLEQELLEYVVDADSITQ
ncbi:BTB/POZ and TAZ domain-containing protein 3-like [Solanum verrucosum]|uniref:BTB/POZ and TAZ domain-containing protein 3-like n=1 Tax=Solanum verrucosum TaxID=315347 RepID=UPI0020D19D61|nr:BTB/POZ and TAZ domain-containing protein 3-like [Solanum verrucosum]